LNRKRRKKSEVDDFYQKANLDVHRSSMEKEQADLPKPGKTEKEKKIFGRRKKSINKNKSKQKLNKTISSTPTIGLEKQSYEELL